MSRRPKRGDAGNRSRTSSPGVTDAPVRTGGGRSRRPIALLLLAVALLVAGVIVGVNWRSRVVAAGRLPVVPDLIGRPKALQNQIAEADALARRSPQSSEAVGALGMAYHSALLYEPAVAAYAIAAEVDPQGWRWPYYRALVHLERAEAPEARDLLRIVVARRPDFGLAWWRLGETLLKQTHYDEAEAAYARAEQSPRADPMAAHLADYAKVDRARLALLRGDAKAAETLLVPVIKADPRFGAAYRILAEALRSQGQSAEADRAAARGAALPAYTAPDDPFLDALVDISRSSVFLLRSAASIDLRRNPGRRERVVRRALESDPDNPDVVYEMGALLQQLGRTADAIPHLTRHLDLVDDDQQTLVQLGKCYGDLNRLDDAERTLRTALAMGDDAVGFHNLGVVLEQRGRVQEAEASYRRAIALGPGLARARNNLGGLLAQTGRLPEATTHLLEAIRLDPSTPDAYTNLAAVFLQRADFREAARYGELAIDVDPQHADAHANLGVALAGLGDAVRARQHLAEALRLNPRHENAKRNLDALKGI